MKIHKIKRDRCSEVIGLAVVIDVIKAFTTAAYAFHAGTEQMILVGPIEEAFKLYSENPHYQLIGESFGYPIEGFHYHNSPTEIGNKNLKGRTLVLRTSSGTQGVVNCTQASHILAASFVVAEATLQKILEIEPKEVTFVITGTRNGDEDAALADYFEARLTQKKASLESFLQRVLESPHGSHALANPKAINCSKKDLDSVMRVDAFDFALEVRKEKELFVMRPTKN